MSLFVKQNNSEDKPLYTTVASMRQYNTGQESQTLLIVGLGNIGKKYENTRHNIGFSVVDAFAKNQNFPDWQMKKDLSCEITSNIIGPSKVLLCKPTTYMNASGEAVQKLQHFYKIDIKNTLVVYDELDIGFGIIRTRVGGSDAGHNGVKSIIEHIGENFGRVRIGIGPKVPDQIDSADFVLQAFSSEQQKQLANLSRESSSILSEYIFSSGKLEPDTRSFLI